MKRRPHFLNNKDLLNEAIACKSVGKMSDLLAKMLMLMVERLSKKGNFASYTYLDDMKGDAIASLMKTWAEFNPLKSSNAFAFYTQCIKNSFIQCLNKEKKQRNIRDSLLVDAGLDPSFSYQLDYAADRGGDASEIVVTERTTSERNHRADVSLVGD